MRLTAGQVTELFKEDYYLTIQLQTTAGQTVRLRGRLLVQLAGPSFQAG